MENTHPVNQTSIGKAMINAGVEKRLQYLVNIGLTDVKQ